MGFLGIIQNDIKRVIAYSTVPNKVYDSGIGCFCLFGRGVPPDDACVLQGAAVLGGWLGHHGYATTRHSLDDDVRKYMPITWITFLLGSLALIQTPFFSGFYSRLHHRSRARQPPGGVGITYFAVIAGVFVTAFYSFRLYFLVFHGKERYTTRAGRTPRRRPWA